MQRCLAGGEKRTSGWSGGGEERPGRRSSSAGTGSGGVRHMRGGRWGSQTYSEYPEKISYSYQLQ
eukprot:scaffold69986_cov32-Prasinocladus_malaysianus.AAC.1